MKVLILICNRLIKVLGNSTKALCYVFHYFFPHKRFTIPKKGKAFFRTRQNNKISAILWQTNYTNRVSLPVYLNYLFNRLMSPAYEYRFMDTQDRLDFIKENYPGDICKTYIKLNIGAAQADFWRLLVLKKHGGIYMDIDAHLVWPMSLMIKPDYDELYVKTRVDHFTNYFLASKKDNPNLDKIIKVLLENINTGRVESVYDMTGPPALNVVLENQVVNQRCYRYTSVQGSFTNEYFQYIDKPNGKWTHAKSEDLLSGKKED